MMVTFLLGCTGTAVSGGDWNGDGDRAGGDGDVVLDGSIDGDPAADGDAAPADGDAESTEEGNDPDGDAATDGDPEPTDGDQAQPDGDGDQFDGDETPTDGDETNPDGDETITDGDETEADVDTAVETWLDPESGLEWQAMPALVREQGDCYQRCYLSMSHEEAEAYCGGLGDGWRLPTIDELRTLVTGCDKTTPEGWCGVHDDCTVWADCRGEVCDGCDPNPDNPSGCFWPEALSVVDGSQCLQFWSSTRATASWWVLSFLYASIETETVWAYVRCIHGEAN
jgi:hypothetical protein